MSPNPPLPKEAAKPRVAEFRIPLAKSRRWPPDFSVLSRLGFDYLSITRSGATARRVHGSDLSGRPFLFTELCFSRTGITLRYSCPDGFEEKTRHLHAALLLLYSLQVLPGLFPDPAGLPAITIPALEAASKSCSLPYEQLSAKYTMLQSENAGLSSQNARLLRSSEQSAGDCLALEQEAKRLRARIAALEAVPDATLRELLLDYLSSHRGSFDSAQFSRAAGIPPARCEEGLEMLLKSGAIRKTAAHSYQPLPGSPQQRQFWLRPAGLLGQLPQFLGKKKA